ncbi:GmrSD restriction endonuclease domain-containing protein [Haemophilus influenzae]|uniref:GmrSD restriction endonuclease domain-containing protein n=1 Tax=Haemophilus influenzae TaxID=727 RepID=UPI000D005986|nr:DUF262 domain-containing protein [Haemophilus influenzae]PRI47036.1 hypothetical protein BVZ70_00343 [Haemophilus influenzae]PRI91373.1 hypothetical protein BV021_00177 [Haemophilus influenzae]PRJ82255.1 hypothetical protein BV154_01000 [Haemophilus influenzae]PRM42874.1 hypothetical protein BVZ69_00581 [Haemophilus influenzae]
MSLLNSYVSPSELQKDIQKARKSVHTDGYSMSIGELVNLYDDKEMDIRPEFQRLFRWNTEQKSKFIESILLGIPLPSIFVSQREDGIWEVVDGLQRLSTILQFMGKLRKNENELFEPLKLVATKYLPSLEEMMWQNTQNPEKELDSLTKLTFKREKMDIKIIKKESESDTKLELFQRLNSNGSKLSDQEIRNVILLMENAEAQHWIEKLAQYSSFKETTPISEKQESEAFNLELLIRYFSLRNLKKHNTILEQNRDIDPYLDEMASNMFSGFNFKAEEELFEKVFLVFDNVFGSNAFKKFNREKNRYTGAISLPIYELFTYHLSKKLEAEPNLHKDRSLEPLLERISQQLEDNSIYKAVISQSRGVDRMATVTSILDDGNLFV